MDSWTNSTTAHKRYLLSIYIAIQYIYIYIYIYQSGGLPFTYCNIVVLYFINANPRKKYIIMVSDPRVSRALEQQLGGVYRDPARVNRDTSSVLRSSIGTNLQPIVTLYADESTGDTSTVLDLQGTIAIHYRGQTYQLLMDIYIIDQYPIKPPVCYVRLVPNMYIKANHKHVQSDTGRVYIPYLSEWNASTHNLIELIVAISSIFSNDPPVFSRPPPPVPSLPSLQQQPPPPSISATSTTSNRWSAATSSNNSNNNNNHHPTHWRTQQQQLEAALAREAEEANQALEAVRNNEREETERQTAIQVYEATQLQHLKNTLNAKIQTYCREQRTNVQQRILEDYNDSSILKDGTAVQKQIQEYQTLRNKLQHQLTIVDEQANAIQVWLQQHQQHGNGTTPESSSSSNGGTTTTTTITIDDMVTASNPIQDKMIEYEAEYHTIRDTLYFLDKALYEQTISVDVHLKHVRTLAKQQFYCRAHFLKLQQELLLRRQQKEQQEPLK
jgi:ESCRT-I complex subunit TSG101